jgi:hypothetical protein
VTAVHLVARCVVTDEATLLSLVTMCTGTGELVVQCKRTSACELSGKEQFVFANIAQTNTSQLTIHLTNRETRAYERLNSSR